MRTWEHIEGVFLRENSKKNKRVKRTDTIKWHVVRTYIMYCIIMMSLFIENKENMN